MGRPWRRREDGAAAVEFALLVPVLLLITFGSIQYGFYFFQATAAEHAVREGARLAAVGNLGGDQIGARLQERAGSAAVRSDVAVSFCYRSQDATPELSRGDDIIVTMRWEPVRFGLPVPFLDTELQTERAQTRAEQLGAFQPPACAT